MARGPISRLKGTKVPDLTNDQNSSGKRLEDAFSQPLIQTTSGALHTEPGKPQFV